MSVLRPIHDERSLIRHPKALSKRKMIEQLRSSYYPSFGDSFETPEERKIRLAKVTNANPKSVTRGVMQSEKLLKLFKSKF